MKVEKEVLSKELIKIEKAGKFGKLTKKEFNEKLKVEKAVTRTTNAKTFEGYLNGSIRVARQEKNLEVAILLEHLLKKYREYQLTGKIKLKSWKGKSSIQFIKSPDKIIVITYQKKDQDHEPQEVRTEITKEEINYVIASINQYELNKKIRTKEIAEKMCRIADIKENNEGRSLFDRNGFVYQHFFADRRRHIKFNLILRFLDYEKIILYRGKSIEIKDNKVKIDEVML